MQADALEVHDLQGLMQKGVIVKEESEAIAEPLYEMRKVKAEEVVK